MPIRIVAKHGRQGAPEFDALPAGYDTPHVDGGQAAGCRRMSRLTALWQQSGKARNEPGRPGPTLVSRTARAPRLRFVRAIILSLPAKECWMLTSTRQRY